MQGWSARKLGRASMRRCSTCWMVGRSVILRCEALLLDLDGVLVDSAACVEATWRRWAVAHDLDPVAVIADAHGRRTIDTIRRLAPHLAVQDEVAALVASEATTTEGVHEVPGARSLLEHLP